MGQKIRVKNRSAGNVVYRVPDMGVRRDFTPGEVKIVDYEELRQLSYTQGGAALIGEYLQVLDKPVLKQMYDHVEPEYNFSDDDIKALILTGSLDSFLDALDFAPIGVLDLIKKYAVSLPMADLNKMNALKEKLGFDVQVAIASEAPDPDEKIVIPEKATRRVKVETEEAPKKTTRRRKTTEEPAE